MKKAIIKLKILSRKYLFRKIENRYGIFLTTYARPIKAAKFNRKSKPTTAFPPYSIVIQGPLALKFDFTVETVKMYRQLFPEATIIVSTWKDEDGATVAKLEELGSIVLLNDKPANAGWGNINLQIVSSLAGIKKAEELGAEYVFKTRTDQRVYSANVYAYFLSLLKLFPSQTAEQKNRLIGASFNTFKYRPYSISDTFLFGNMQDMVKFWDAPLDVRTSAPEIEKTTISWVEAKPPEVYLMTNYLEKIGHKVEMTLVDSWKAYSDYFCIVDQKSIDLFFHKYEYYLEYRRMYYDGAYLDEELFFEDWLLIHDSFLTGNDADRVPVEQEFTTKFNLTFNRTVEENMHRKDFQIEQEARQNIRALKSSPKNAGVADWQENLAELRTNILKKDMSDFLQWPVIRKTMFHECAQIELDTLKKSPQWIELEKALKETWVGNPPAYADYPASSGNKIHQLYNLYQLMSHYQTDFSALHSIVEFGGGYGLLCSILFGLGYKGSYAICDFPEFTILQNYYLQANKIIPAHKVIFVCGESDSSKKQSGSQGLSRDLIIATWSLSEAPLDIRKQFLSSIGSPNYFLIAYQKEFAGIDNRAYFKNFKVERAAYDWIEYEIPHLKGNYYLLGKKRHGN